MSDQNECASCGTNTKSLTTIKDKQFCKRCISKCNKCSKLCSKDAIGRCNLCGDLYCSRCGPKTSCIENVCYMFAK